MTTQTLTVNDPRIDNALASKPFDELFELIKKHPEIMTLERIPKFIKRCTPEAKGKMNDFLGKRYGNHFRNDNKDADLFWNKEIVSTMIDDKYFSDEYDYHRIVELVKKYDDGNAMKLGFQWFGKAAYSFQLNNLYELKPCFTPNYIQKRLEEGHYREILTLAAIRALKLPQQLTKNQKRNLRKYMFEVLTLNYYEKNINSAQTYAEERKIRTKTLFEQCPDLFTIKDIVTVALTSNNLAKEIYNKMNPGHKEISQKTIGKFLDNKQCCQSMMLLLVWYDIVLDSDNIQKIYTWIKKTMGSHDIVHGGHGGWQYNQTIDLFQTMSTKYNIILPIDDFFDVLASVGGQKEDLDIKGYSEKKLMKKFFDNYIQKLPHLCNYEYRSQIKNKRKKKILLDLFFWKRLPWRNLYKEEKIALQEYIEMYAEKYPKQTLFLAQKHPSIITLSDQAKFAIFVALAKKDPEDESSEYSEFNFGPGINNEIVLSVHDFMSFAEKRIDDLYKIIQIPQIKFDTALNRAIEPAKFSVWWGKFVYMLILLQAGKYTPTKKEALSLLKTFCDNRIAKHYFLSAWKALTEKVKPTALELCVLENEKSSEEPKFDVLSCLLKNNLLVLDEVLIEKLISLYTTTKKQYRIDEISKFEIINAPELSIQIENYKLEAILNWYYAVQYFGRFFLFIILWYVVKFSSSLLFTLYFHLFHHQIHSIHIN